MEQRFLSVLVVLIGMVVYPTSVLIEGSRVVHGEHHERSMRWDRWTEWSHCSAKCGTGVSVRSRACRSLVDGTTAEGCHGVSKETKLCTADPCKTDEAVEACRDLDLQLFSGRRYRWEPYIHPNNKCELACRAVGFGFYKSLEKSKTDGSPCDTDARHVCVEGTCKTYGCDKIIDSNAATDMCGICKGDNSTCRIVSKVYTDNSDKSGYSTITTIPTGVRHINITELKPSRNYLALNEVGGSFRLNTDWRLSRRGNHSGAGTNFIYGEQLNEWCPGECITAEGPTTSPIELIVLFYTQNEGVAISYSQPIDAADELNLGQNVESVHEVDDSIHHHKRHQHRRPIHSHDFTFMKSRSYRDRVTNGNGNSYDLRSEVTEGRTNVRSPIIVEDAFENDPYATNNANKSNSSAVLKNSHRDGLSGPVIADGDFNGVGLSKNATIMPPGVTNGSEYEKRESSTDATKELLPEDMYSRDNVIGTPYSWRKAGFTECSVTCGEGKRTSILQCIVTAKNKTVDDSYCRNLIKPRDEVLSCTRQLCTASWRTDPWGKCNVTCGSGYRLRNVVCLSSGGATLDERECNSVKPETSETCDMGSCTTGWFFTEWEKTCPFECGNGIQTRKVHCIGTVNTVGAGGVSDTCSLQGMPSSERTCQVDKPCHVGGTWFTGPWGQCNATCGQAYQMRTVICMRRREDGSPSSVVADHQCTSEDKPPTYMSCDVEPCQPEWYMTEWGACSVTCGAGQKTRGVRCLNASTTTSASCSLNSKPEETESCQVDRQCTSADEGALVQEGIDKDCNDTFARCDMVIRANLCRYRYYARICCKSCSEAAKY
ncbi:hypothetical protein CHS0354_001611 [Potamilus streckersoni]|uniref:PLAC domain-containing protein n=1 Tax=Potamilus streckersoni TaxID=2493646 RepID=A0AAE0T2H0_9BIVA|nr:hypothetical protein CHS0354_001611 [Potamilus streckersoni]